MRSRWALIAITTLVAVAAVVTTMLVGGPAAPADQQEALSSNSTSIQATPSPTTPGQFGMIRSQTAAAEQATAYAAQLTAFLGALSQASARERAASLARSGPTSPASTTTAAPAGCTTKPTADYALDATTTDTPDWCCIRVHESDANRYRDYSGAYGFQPGYYASMAPADQDALALSIFHHNGDKFGPTAWSTHTVCGLS